MTEAKAELATLLNESKELERKIKIAFRLAEDTLPKHQRSEQDRQQALLAIDSLQIALIRAKAMIQ